MLDAIVERLPADDPGSTARDDLAVAIVGQPNVGKSSLLNALLGEERSIVSDVPGTTRDAIDTVLDLPDGRIRLIDTAGIRRAALPLLAILLRIPSRRCARLAAVARCDLALLVIDALKGTTLADRRLAGLVLEERKGLIIVANKWDLVRAQGEYSQPELPRGGAARAKCRSASVRTRSTFLSALTHRRLGSLLPMIARVAENLDRRVPTARVNATRSATRCCAIRRRHRRQAGAHLLRGASPPHTRRCSCSTATIPALDRMRHTRAYLENVMRDERRLRRRSADVRVPRTRPRGRSGVIAAALVAFAFVFGSIPFGVLVGRAFFASDLRASGSGNIGAANALRTYGKGAGLTVLLLDALKGWFPRRFGWRAALGAKRLPWVAVAAGAAALLGHCYSPFLGLARQQRGRHPPGRVLRSGLAKRGRLHRRLGPDGAPQPVFVGRLAGRNRGQRRRAGRRARGTGFGVRARCAARDRVAAPRKPAPAAHRNRKRDEPATPQFSITAGRAR